MNSEELFEYLRSVSDYIEYSFYTNASEIMDAICKRGFPRVLEIISVKEVSKGLYECQTNWKLGLDNIVTKVVTVDMTTEMVFITEKI